MQQMKVVILGPGRCGKDEVAERLAQALGVRCAGSVSTWMCAHVARVMGITPSEAYLGRRQRREEWRRIIDEYRQGDPARILREMLKAGSVVAGVRARAEFEAGKAEGLWTFAVWVARPGTPPDPTLDLTAADADVILLNDGDLRLLQHRVERLAVRMREAKIQVEGHP